jgi:hypothetical protein
MTSSQNSESASSSYVEVINPTKGKSRINIGGFLYIKDKIAMICIVGFANAKDKKKRNVLQGPLQLILGTSIRFANLMLSNTIMLQKQESLNF